MVLGSSMSFNALGFLMCMNFNIFQYLALYVFNPIQDGGGKKAPSYQFFPCNFYKRWN